MAVKSRSVLKLKRFIKGNSKDNCSRSGHSEVIYVCNYMRNLSFFFSHLSLSLGILSVLSLSSECTSLASELPKVSYVKAIDIWMIACLLYGFGSLVEYAVVQVCMHVCCCLALKHCRTTDLTAASAHYMGVSHFGPCGLNLLKINISHSHH